MTDATLRDPAPLDTAPLFPPLHAALLDFLRGLEPAEWELPTVAGAWRVRDIAAHLLDGDLRKLSAHRDGHLLADGPPPRSYEDVVALIGRLNASGVQYVARLGTPLLTDLLEVTGRWVSEFVQSLDPEAPALFSVAWAGEQASTNRFDTAREYTERWHHQMQMRSAVGARGRVETLLGPAFALPLLETSVRALPHAYRDVPASEGDTVVLRVSDLDGASWTLRREPERWRLFAGHVTSPTALLETSCDVAWRLFYNALPAERAAAAVTMRGRESLVAPLLRARSVMV
jgi:hypothetical protein